MSKSNREKYGTFVTKQPWHFKRKQLTVAVIGAVLVFSGAIFLFQQNKDKDLSLFEIPEVLATEMPGWWYKDYFGSSVCEIEDCKSESDPDRDKLTNAQEFYYHTDPLNFDTNKNGLTDGEDVAHNYDPSRPGKVTFDEVASDDNIFGESLVFGDDVKTIINETIDPNKVRLPTIKDEELHPIETDSVEALESYVNENSAVLKKYFSGIDFAKDITPALETGDRVRIDDLKERSLRAYLELKKVKVPRKALQLHKYSLAFLDLMPKILTVPAPELLANELNPQSNIWFDNVQAFSLVNQKIEIEISQVLNQYK